MMNLSMFALQGIATTEDAESKAEADRLRSAIRITLTAAGVDPSGLAARPRARFGDESAHRALIVLYDGSADAMRLFAPPIAEVDEPTRMALELLRGTFTSDPDVLPIEDVDALARVLCVLGAAESVEALHASLIAPRLDAYDEDFTAPSVEDLAELWETLFPYYIGGTSFAPAPLDAWITRAYAFGISALG